MRDEQVRWHVVRGFGGHIKATPSVLSIQQKGVIQEYPLSSVDHLLVVGGHTLHTSAIIHLLRAGSVVSFFDADAVPLGSLRPYGYTADEDIHHTQRLTPPHSYAVEIAKSALKARLIMIEQANERLQYDLFYQGEQEFLHKSLGELEFLIKMDELRRMHKLGSDMYYEIMARSLPPEIGFKRRAERPHSDPVNAMLSLGYAVLFGSALYSILGAHLDPDIGFLSLGERSLVQDLIDPLKASMIDGIAFDLVREGLSANEYDCTTSRCHLSDGLTERFLTLLYRSVDPHIIDVNVANYLSAIQKEQEFQFLY